jgi:hypothetical protein
VKRQRLALRAAALATAVAAGVVPAQRATATSLDPGSENRVRLVVLGNRTTAQLVPLRVENMAPGVTVIQRFRLHLTGHQSGHPAVLIGRVRDLERGCSHPERAAGDDSCGTGDDQGELSQQLLAGAAAQPASDAKSCDETAPIQPTSPLAALTDATLTAGLFDATGADTCVTLTVTLPASADNLVQSDAVAFDASVGLVGEGLTHASLVRGASNSGAQARMLPAGESGARLPLPQHSLPFTGQPVVAVALVGLGLIELALAALALGRRRTQVEALRR